MGLRNEEVKKLRGRTIPLLEKGCPQGGVVERSKEVKGWVLQMIVNIYKYL